VVWKRNELILLLYQISSLLATTTKAATSTHKATTSKPASASIAPAASSGVASQSYPLGIYPNSTGVNPSATSAISATPSSDASQSSSGLSTGAIGGIAAVAAVAAVGVGAFAFIRYKRKNKPSAAPSNYPRTIRQSMAEPFSMGFVGASKAQPQMSSQDNPFPPAAPYERLEEPKSLGVYDVVSTYTPTLGDEIDIRLGDRIRVLVEYDDGWMLGENLSNNDAKGVFPRHCIDYPGNENYAQPAYAVDQPSEATLQVHGDNRRSKRVSSLYSAGDFK
jgi:hypothetical protein